MLARIHDLALPSKSTHKTAKHIMTVLGMFHNDGHRPMAAYKATRQTQQCGIPKKKQAIGTRIPDIGKHVG